MLAPCDSVEEAPEITELREIVEEYDELYEICMSVPLEGDELDRIDDLYSELMLRELRYWVGVDKRIVKMLIDETALDFPMVRQELGMLIYEI